jgi:hypothetical protein
MKYVATVLVLISALSLSACNGNPSEAKNTGEPKSQAGKNVAAAHKAVDSLEASQDKEKDALDAMASEEMASEDDESEE